MIGGEEAFGFALVERGHGFCIGPGVAGVKRRPSFLQPLSIRSGQLPGLVRPRWAPVSCGPRRPRFSHARRTTLTDSKNQVHGTCTILMAGTHSNGYNSSRRED